MKKQAQLVALEALVAKRPDLFSKEDLQKLGVAGLITMNTVSDKSFKLDKMSGLESLIADVKETYAFDAGIVAAVADVMKRDSEGLANLKEAVNKVNDSLTKLFNEHKGIFMTCGQELSTVLGSHHEAVKWLEHPAVQTINIE